MNDALDRLVEVGQRLDELSDDLPELAELSEEIGKIAERWPQPEPQRGPDIPEYLAQIQQIMERGAEEILYRRYGGPRTGTNSPYITVNIPNHAYYDAGLLNPKDAFKAITSVV